MHPISEMMEMQASVLSCMVQVKIKKEDFYAASQAGTSHFRWLWSLECANFDIFIRNVVFFVHLFFLTWARSKAISNGMNMGYGYDGLVWSCL